MGNQSKQRPDEERKLGIQAYFAMLSYARERVYFGCAKHTIVRQELTELISEVFNTPFLSTEQDSPSAQAE